MSGNDWVVRYQNRLLQVQKMKRHSAPAQAKVMVCEWEDSRLEIRYRGQVMAWKEILHPRPAAALDLRLTGNSASASPLNAPPSAPQGYALAESQ